MTEKCWLGKIDYRFVKQYVNLVRFKGYSMFRNPDFLCVGIPKNVDWHLLKLVEFNTQEREIKIYFEKFLGQTFR